MKPSYLWVNMFQGSITMKFPLQKTCLSFFNKPTDFITFWFFSVHLYYLLFWKLQRSCFKGKMYGIELICSTALQLAQPLSWPWFIWIIECWHFMLPYSASQRRWTHGNLTGCSPPPCPRSKKEKPATMSIVKCQRLTLLPPTHSFPTSLRVPISPTHVDTSHAL